MRWSTTRLVLMVASVLVCVSVLNASAAARREVVDQAGRKVQVPEHPSRVLCLCTSVTDTMVRLGAAERLAGIDEYSRVVPGASNLVVLSKGSAISREQVLARRLDLAFVWWYQDDAVRTLEDLHIPTVKIRCGRAEEVPATIRCVGDCLGLSEASNELAQRVSGEVEALRRSAPTNGPRVYVELYGPFKTSGRETFLNDLVELAGARNVAGEATGAVLLSGERLLQSNPEVVLLIKGFGTPDEFSRRGGVSGLSAVKDHRVLMIDRACLVAGAGVADEVANLRRLLSVENQIER
jgi:iron complex transport system substrate-binding protein